FAVFHFVRDLRAVPDPVFALPESGEVERVDDAGICRAGEFPETFQRSFLLSRDLEHPGHRADLYSANVHWGILAGRAAQPAGVEAARVFSRRDVRSVHYADGRDRDCVHDSLWDEAWDDQLRAAARDSVARQ